MGGEVVRKYDAVHCKISLQIVYEILIQEE